jgi:Lon-like protease
VRHEHDTVADPVDAVLKQDQFGDLLEPENLDPRSRWDQLKPWIAALLLIVASGNVIRVPFYSAGVGPATDVLQLIDVSGIETHPSDGDLLLTTVSISSRSLSVFEYLWALADPGLEIIPAEFIRPPGVSDDEQTQLNLRAMEISKQEAELAAFTALGWNIPGVRIVSVSPDGASAGILEAEDRVIRFNGKKMKGPVKLVNAIAATTPGDVVPIEIERNDERLTVEVTMGQTDGQPRLGVTLLPAFDIAPTVEIDTQRIGGPSGGLVFALALVEVLGEQDLTRGRTIAVTGTMEFRGSRGVVGPIGGVAEKLRGALAAGADMLIVPQQNYQDALALAPEGFRVVGVKTLEEAIAALEAD